MLRTYNEGEVKMINKDAEQNRYPNFKDADGKFYLVRCFACSESERGRENYVMAVSSGQCAWCGWEEKSKGK